VWEFKKINDLTMRIVAPHTLFIQFIHQVWRATQLPIERKQKVWFIKYL